LALLSDGDDAEMAELAAMELEELETKLPEMEAALGTPAAAQRQRR
jgi:protein subunit release factor A